MLLAACTLVQENPTPVVRPTFIPTFIPVPTPASSFVPLRHYYVDGNSGSDPNAGSQSQPWRTIERALQSLQAGDTLYVRGGIYPTIYGGWHFQNSGTGANPITVSNYPGEQVILQISGADKNFLAFGCWYSAADPPSWQTPKADFIRIVGSDVAPQRLASGVTSSRGIVIQGVPGTAAGVEVGGDCDNWEISGVDFIDVGYGIFTKKRVFGSIDDRSPNHWYVHDNRVYGFYRESGMQFNGNYNVIDNNQIYKVTEDVSTPYGCHMINLNGNNNVVRGNILSRMGSHVRCVGILLEWDLADKNLIEYNQLMDVGWRGMGAVAIAGGDNNVIRYNTIYASSPKWYYIYPNNDGFKGWPCNEETADKSDIPADDPAAEDYPYYYPHNCHSVGNVIYANTYIERTVEP